MNSQELRALQEAYSQVYELDEEITSEKGKAKAVEMIAARTTASGRAKSGQGANVAQIKHIGRANVDGYGGTPPNRKVAKNPVKSNFTGLKGGTGNKAARRAAALNTESYDLYDIILSHLLDEGYADTEQAAEAIMVNMSEDWRESIVEVLDTPEKANQYAMKALGSAANATLTKDKKTLNKRLAGLKMGQRKAERKAAEEG